MGLEQRQRVPPAGDAGVGHGLSIQSNGVERDCGRPLTDGVKTLYSALLRSNERRFLERQQRDVQAHPHNEPTPCGSGHVRARPGVHGASGTGQRIASVACKLLFAGARIPQGSGPSSFSFHPIHFGCVDSLRCRAKWCWRCAMCATPGQRHVQRDTTSDGMLAFGHSRSGCVLQITEEGNPRCACAWGAEIGRNDWAAPEPVTGWNFCAASQRQRHDHQPPRRCDMKPIKEDDVCFRGHEQTTQGLAIRDASQAR